MADRSNDPGDDFVEETPEGAEMHQPGRSEAEGGGGRHGARAEAEEGEAAGDPEIDPALDPGGGVDPL